MAAKLSNAWLAGCFSASYLIFNPLEGYLAGNNEFLRNSPSSRGLKDSGNLLVSESERVEKIDKGGNTFLSIEDQDPSLIPLNIQAKRQYWESNNIFIAEGNVITSLNRGTLRSGRLVFDQAKNTIIATDNVRFSRGGQYFRANYFIYNFNNQKGEIKDVYGVISIELLPTDLNIKSKFKGDSKNGKSALTLKDSILIEGGKIDAGMNPFYKGSLLSEGINSWRFKASKILINNSGWKAKKIIFSNDPFNPVQTKILAQDVVATENNLGKSIITANRSKLVIEDKLTLPLGKRTFGGGNQAKQSWVLGYDYKDRDGFFLGRRFNPIDINKNYTLKLQPQFLIQRAIKSETNSYPEAGSSVLSPSVKRSAKVSDLFGLKAKLKGKTFNLDSELSASISTFNIGRLPDGSRYWGSLKQAFSFAGIDGFIGTLFGAYRYKTWNGSLGQSDIYTAYGGYIDKNVSWDYRKTNFAYRFRSGMAKYQAEQLKKVDLENLWRTSIFNSLSISRPIYSFGKGINLNSSSPPRYSVLPVKPGITFNTVITASYYYYEDNSNQSSIGISAGPEITFGHFRKPILDYTKVSIMPGFTAKGGDSPFKFDNVVDLRKVSFKLTQQIYGPFLLSGIYDVNVDSGSDQYGKTINSKVALLWERRSFSFGLFYDINDNNGGLMFRLNGFDFDGSLIPLDTQSM
ncbi:MULTISPECIES: DUF3769 domain-containing protein [Prochlorococcus]|uniref:DUF3769 domain-containing protein n=1 Tax=Prochlorococcus TaxID=1218 RepID=UPI000533978B|nr:MULTISPECIES: DUF3769 domain-containing protein [Prochlorococcus]KGG13111.1 Repeats containing protein [Prochlorococcus sp. MIT 0601]